MTVLCHLNQISEGQARGFEIGGIKLVLVSYRGELHLYRNSCPHRSIPLEWMPDQFLDYEKNFIQCATHGALFRIEDGLCISGPCVEDRLDVVAFHIENGLIMLDQPLLNDSIKAVSVVDV